MLEEQGRQDVSSDHAAAADRHARVIARRRAVFQIDDADRKPTGIGTDNRSQGYRQARVEPNSARAARGRPLGGAARAAGGPRLVTGRRVAAGSLIHLRLSEPVGDRARRY
jgi:hypothetical protein